MYKANRVAQGLARMRKGGILPLGYKDGNVVIGSNYHFMSEISDPPLKKRATKRKSQAGIEAVPPTRYLEIISVILVLGLTTTLFFQVLNLN